MPSIPSTALVVLPSALAELRAAPEPDTLPPLAVVRPRTPVVAARLAAADIRPLTLGRFVDTRA